MEAYLLKASAILGLFLLTYQLLLRKETFFQLNRYFLLAGIGAALLLPLVTIPEEVIIPVELIQARPASERGTAMAEASPGWEVLLQAAYLLGTLFLTGLAGRQLWSLRKLMRNPKSRREDGVVLVPTNRIQSPFSFFRYIFYNPEVHDEVELQQVLEHEKAHARQLHSLDVLLGRLTAILLWVNPLAWWYQKCIVQNLEYLADARAVQKLACVKEYQYTLLKVSGNRPTPALVNPFNSSLIKKRIVMLQQNQSKTIHLLKYLLILPVLAAFLMAFNREPVYVPQGESVQELILSADKTIEVIIDKKTTDEELVDLKEKLAKDGVDFSYTTVRNERGEIINLSFSISGKADNGNPFSGTYNSDSEEPVKPVMIYINSEGGVFFGEANTFREFSTGKEVHFTTGSGENMIWVQRSGEEDGELVGIRNTKGKQVFIVNGKEVSVKEGEEAYLRQLEKREKMMILEMEEDAQTIEVSEKDGKKIIVVNGEEVSEEEFGREGRAEKIFVKMLETDEDPDVEVEIKEIRVSEDGVDRIIEVVPQGDDKDRYKAITIDLDKAGDFSHGKSKVIFLDEGKDPLIYIDGKKASKKKMNALDPDQIQSINVRKGDKAVEEYGKKAADGVIEITTKKQ